LKIIVGPCLLFPEDNELSLTAVGWPEKTWRLIQFCNSQPSAKCILKWKKNILQWIIKSMYIKSFKSCFLITSSHATGTFHKITEMSKHLVKWFKMWRRMCFFVLNKHSFYHWHGHITYVSQPNQCPCCDYDKPITAYVRNKCECCPHKCEI